MAQALDAIGTEAFLAAACRFLARHEAIARRVQGHDLLLPPAFLPDAWVDWAERLTDGQYDAIAADLSPSRDEDYAARVRRVTPDAPESLLAFLAEAWSVTPRRTTDPARFEQTAPLLCVPAKKSRQITLLARVVRRLADETGCSQAVDMGCGVGHLARELYRAGLGVLGVERSAPFTETARRLTDGRFLRAAGGEGRAIAFQEHTFTEADAAADSAFPRGLAPGTRYVLAGLHTCGDFGPAICRLFANKAAAAGLVHIPCCFHCLTPRGFPLSAGLRRLLPFETTQELRNLGLQDPATALAPSAILGKRARRYAFEVAMRVVNRDYDPGLYARRIRRDERREDFPSYVRRQFAHLREARGAAIDEERVLREALREPVLSGAGPDAAPEGLDYDGLCLRLYDRVICPRTRGLIRLSVVLCFAMAGCVEGLVVGDRALFLREAGARVSVSEVWPVGVSPRNIMLVAAKGPGPSGQ